MKQTRTFSVRYLLTLTATLLTVVNLSTFRDANALVFSAEPTLPTGPGPVGSIDDLTGPMVPGIDPEPLAPSLGPTIETINFDADATNSGFYHIPPDPIGAAGPNHVVNVVNTSIEWYTKAGVQQNSESLADFFTSLSPATNTFDPKVIYDQYAGRFLVVTLEVVDNGANELTNVSSIFVAVSDDSNPNGTWYFTSIDAKEDISSNDHWADYPGFAVGENAVYNYC
jgi:hypothetical protein